MENTDREPQERKKTDRALIHNGNTGSLQADGRRPGADDQLFRERFPAPRLLNRKAGLSCREPRVPLEAQGTGDAITLTDGALVEQCLSGKKEAYTEIVQRYQHIVFRIAMGLMRSRAGAEDLAQETFIQAYRKLSKYDHSYSFKNWLLTICVNQGKNRLRTRARRQKNMELYAADQEPSRKAAGTHPHDLRRELEKIPEKLRVPLLMKHAEGFSYHEIAEVLKIGVSAAKMRVKRGRDALMQVLEPVR